MKALVLLAAVLCSGIASAQTVLKSSDAVSPAVHGQPIEIVGGNGSTTDRNGAVRLRPGTATDWLEAVLDDAGFPVFRLNSIASTQIIFGSNLTLGAGSNVIIPYFPDATYLGWINRHWKMVMSMLYRTQFGAALTAAATLSPTTGLHSLSGDSAVVTYIVPPDPLFVGTMRFLPEDATVFSTGGNIKREFVATPGVPVEATYDGVLFWLK